jgi:acyl-CoA thioesterase-1
MNEMCGGLWDRARFDPVGMSLLGRCIGLVLTAIAFFPSATIAAENEASTAAKVAAWEARIPQRLRDRMTEPTMGAAFAYVEDDPRLPRVLLIGDSISIGYTGDVRRMLQGRANVHRVPDNAANTGHGLANLEAWLGTGRWDVIHFNWGLHDLVVRRDGQHAVPPEQYRKNLDTLVGQLKQTGATLIFATTTAVPEGEKGRRAGSEKKYNPVAVEVMKRQGVTINDLDAAIRPHLGEYQAKNDVHFGPPGARFLAEKVAEKIQAALEARKAGRP